MTKKKFSGKKLVKGLIVGSIIGGTAALLLAPRSGKETRAKLTKEIDDNLQLIKNVKVSAENVQTDAKQLEELTETLLPDFIAETKKAVRAFQFKTDPRISDIKKQIEKIKTELSELEKE